MTKKKPKEVIFEEGWADELDLSQEDYDALVRGIQELVATGEIFEDATPIEDLPEESKYQQIFDDI